MRGSRRSSRILDGDIWPQQTESARRFDQWGAVAWIGDEFCCATGAKDSKTVDVSKHPQVEYCFADKEGKHVRMQGTCRISTKAEPKAKLIELYPFLGKFFKGPDDPNYVVLCMKPERIRFMGEGSMEHDEVPID
ncbi:hypothetical protein J7M28_12745 [bacterium]|nr:hypothetical protein [bacterium]